MPSFIIRVRIIAPDSRTAQRLLLEVPGARWAISEDHPLSSTPVFNKEDTNKMRHAIVQGRDLSREQLERYLPANYAVSEELPAPDSRIKAYMIEGRDDSGWTLSGYVIPRLASGLIGCTEVEA